MANLFKLSIMVIFNFNFSIVGTIVGFEFHRVLINYRLRPRHHMSEFRSELLYYELSFLLFTVDRGRKVFCLVSQNSRTVAVVVCGGRSCGPGSGTRALCSWGRSPDSDSATAVSPWPVRDICRLRASAPAPPPPPTTAHGSAVRVSVLGGLLNLLFKSTTRRWSRTPVDFVAGPPPVVSQWYSSPEDNTTSLGTLWVVWNTLSLPLPILSTMF